MSDRYNATMGRSDPHVPLDQPIPKDAGDPPAGFAGTDEMFRAIYEQLRELASGALRGERRGHTLQPTALVHEAYLRLVDREDLEELGRLHERQRRVVELRFFGGLGVEEVARVLGMSTRTVEGDWSMARAWLRPRLEGR